VVAADLRDMDTQIGHTCWDFQAVLPTAGQWACTFRRLYHAPEGGCTDANATARACALVTVE
jgi:hypothetical protein